MLVRGAHGLDICDGDTLCNPLHGWCSRSRRRYPAATETEQKIVSHKEVDYEAHVYKFLYGGYTDHITTGRL